MAIRFGAWWIGASALAMTSAMPAQAGRTAIDQRNNPDGTTTPTSVTVSGYCDIQGDDCGAGRSLGYRVSFDGGANFFSNVIVHGNGLLTFGQAVDFETPVGNDGETLSSLIYQDINPALGDYQRTLISAGQNNSIDYQNQGGPAFNQSASLNVVNQIVTAEWFFCASPQNCRLNPYQLTLTPTANGLSGRFTGGFDQSAVVNGRAFEVGSTFTIPALFEGVTAAVPEPASWALMIVGFGAVGAQLRRRPSKAQPALA
ncbi:PEPxxWA-CTERM sorting domain-containing protein [Sphingomonas aliaeris]|nr:PEPxxWA-CTERM sorting domain-containing protein [Sphingomonas aliaeris]